MESSNPAFNPKTLARLRAEGALETTSHMSLNGTINKVGILVTLTVASSLWGWSMADSEIGPTLAMGSIFLNLILAFVIIYNKSKAPVLAPVYAVVEGLALGFIANMADRSSQGVALQAFIGTFGILFAMVGAYRLGLLRATETFRRVMSLAMMGIMLTYFVDIALMFFGMRVPMVHEGTPFGIIFSLVVIGVASLNFILDFDMIERAVKERAPKWMEWYAGFAVLLTIIWLYLEILRLLNKRR